MTTYTWICIKIPPPSRKAEIFLLHFESMISYFGVMLAHHPSMSQRAEPEKYNGVIISKRLRCGLLEVQQ
jgi:hypothetical protein